MSSFLECMSTHFCNYFALLAVLMAPYINIYACETPSMRWSNGNYSKQIHLSISSTQVHFYTYQVSVHPSEWNACAVQYSTLWVRISDPVRGSYDLSSRTRASMRLFVCSQRDSDPAKSLPRHRAKTQGLPQCKAHAKTTHCRRSAVQLKPTAESSRQQKCG